MGAIAGLRRDLCRGCGTVRIETIEESSEPVRSVGLFAISGRASMFGGGVEDSDLPPLSRFGQPRHRN